MMENSDPSGGYSSYLVAMSIIRAHFPVTLMFHKMYDIAAMGEPAHRNSASTVCQASLLSHGAWTIKPMMGRTHVVMVFAESFLAHREHYPFRMMMWGDAPGIVLRTTAAELFTTLDSDQSRVGRTQDTWNSPIVDVLAVDIRGMIEEVLATTRKIRRHDAGELTDESRDGAGMDGKYADMLGVGSSSSL